MMYACVVYRATYEIAPVYTTIEKIVLNEMCSMLGYKDGDGIFSPGNMNHYLVYA